MIRLSDSVRALLAVLSIFVMGLAVGCGLDRTILAPSANAAAGRARLDAPRHHDEVLAELTRELGLSAKQSARVQDIFEARQHEIEEAWAEVHAKLRRSMRQTTTEIEAVLDSARVERLHAWLAKRHGPTSGHVRGLGH